MIFSNLYSFEDRFADEYKLKSIYIYKISKQIDWSNNDKKVFKIYVITKSKEELIKIPSSKTINDKPIEIIHTSEIEKAIDANVIFIGKDMKDEIEEIYSLVKGKEILTFGDKEDFAGSNMMFSFYLKSNQELSFVSNIKPIKESKIKVNPRVYSISGKMMND